MDLMIDVHVDDFLAIEVNISGIVSHCYIRAYLMILLLFNLSYDACIFTVCLFLKVC